MKLLRVKVLSAHSCGGLLDGLDLIFRSPFDEGYSDFKPLCLVGPNGAGKSQFLQVVAEIFQSLIHAVAPQEERADGNEALLFEIEYLIKPPSLGTTVHIKATRSLQKANLGTAPRRRKPLLAISLKHDGEWVDCNLAAAETRELLPAKVVGYTSGANETLSLPFLLSRGGYADEVGCRALADVEQNVPVGDTALMLIDYGTHLEVLVANLLMGSDEVCRALLDEARLAQLHSFRCIVQLAHSAAPKSSSSRRKESSRPGIQLTQELESYIDQLRRCSTCHAHDPKTDSYTFDFFIDAATKTAFRSFWDGALGLYSALHKLSMLNDLAISKTTRDRFKRQTHDRRFASRLPEPQDDDKVFRFEQVAFKATGTAAVVDYVSLSDGEHQIAQLLGTMCMVSFPRVLFLLDEPESHFNPQWRVKLVSKLMDLPTLFGKRKDQQESAEQDCLLTTHSPFVPSDLPKERVFVFGKDVERKKILVKNPDFETFGTTFDSILSECFDIRPPMSKVSLDRIHKLQKSNDPAEIITGMGELGDSVEKLMLMDRVRQLKKITGG
jgi:restriction system-associated AAA family ATPase